MAIAHANYAEIITEGRLYAIKPDIDFSDLYAVKESECTVCTHEISKEAVESVFGKDVLTGLLQIRRVLSNRENKTYKPYFQRMKDITEMQQGLTEENHRLGQIESVVMSLESLVGQLSLEELRWAKETFDSVFTNERITRG